MRFLSQTGSLQSPAKARFAGSLAVKAITRSPEVYAKNALYTSLWLLNVGITNKPPIYDELSLFSGRLLVDGRRWGPVASNFQGADFSFESMHNLELDYTGRGPVGNYFAWWCVMKKLVSAYCTLRRCAFRNCYLHYTPSLAGRFRSRRHVGVFCCARNAAGCGETVHLHHNASLVSGARRLRRRHAQAPSA